MRTHRRRLQVIAVVAAASLLGASCGTRLDHDDVVRAAGSMGIADGQTGGPGTPGTSRGGVPGAPGDAGSSGESGSTGTGKGAGSDKSAEKSVAGGPGGAARGGPIVIGSAGLSTGVGSAGYRQVGDALRAWAAVTNARGGINGRPIKVIIKDDGGDAAKGRSQVQELVEKDKVVALVANDGWTSSVNAWRGYVEEKKVPAIGGNCYAEAWEKSPVFFSQCPSFDAQLYGSVTVAAKHGRGKKFGALFCTEDAACTTAKDRWFGQGYAKRAGLDPVYRADVSLTQPDYTSECIQARNAGVQVFALAVDAAAVKRIAASCRRQNFTPQFLVPTSVAAPDHAKYLGDVISAQQATPFAGVSSPAYQEFAAAWRKYNQEPPGPLAVNSWAAAKIFEKAARGAKEITRSGLTDALYRFNKERFGGLTVPLSYGPKGTDSANCAFYMKGSGGKWSAPQGDRPICW